MPAGRLSVVVTRRLPEPVETRMKELFNVELRDPDTKMSRDELADAMSEQDQHYNALGELQDFAAMLGQRLAEMHQLLALPSDDPAFGCEVTTAKDQKAAGKAIGAQVEHALLLLEQHQQQP